MNKNKSFSLIAGPTASGKSALALELANKKRSSLIVNCDALQVYGCYEILTARPSKDDLERADHALYGHVPNLPGYSVGSWLREVKILLETADYAHFIFVGGTGLYFDALINGLSEIPVIPKNIRAKLENQLAGDGLGSLVERLKSVDPEIAEELDLQNPRRVIRALEVYHATKTPLSVWQKDHTPAPLVPFDQTESYLIMPDVIRTNQRIETRFHAMVRDGAIEEVEAQMNPWDETLPANKALGAKEIAAYLRGEINKQEAIEASVIATRQYAKRQRSWFRSRMKNWELLEDNKIPTTE